MKRRELNALFDYINIIIRRVRWIALGERLADSDIRTGVEIDTFNLTLPVSTMAEIAYGAKKGMKINCIIATASMMNGFVSIEDGGLEEKFVKIRYTTENGARDEFYVFVESYKLEPLILNDNVARTGNVAIVFEGVRNWTAEILQRFV